MDHVLLDATPKTSVRFRSRILPAAVAGALGLVALVNYGMPSSALPKLRAMSLASNPATFEWVEFRDGSWNGAADGIIAKLKDAGVKRGQIVTIDAHNNGETGDAIFSAHFARSWPDKGDLDIQYTVQNTDDGWSTIYDNACDGVDTTDLIGITASCNSGGYSVQYVFSYAPAAANHAKRNLVWVESRSGAWNDAADNVIAQLKAQGAQRGQVISIDAHNNGAGGDAIFSAFYDTGLPGYGELNINYEVQNTNYAWASFYDQASNDATAAVISITSSVNDNSGDCVTYVFNEN